MRIGFGWLHLSPAEFWSMTIPELVAAADGFLIAAGHNPDQTPHLTREEIAAIEEECRNQGLIP
ncbi:MAG: phage tail assembly chaperone [Methylocystis sp.]